MSRSPRPRPGPSSRGMSRIGPAYTPPEHRGHGYAAAVTAAAARWALERGARQVLLTKSSHRPTSSVHLRGLAHRG